MARTETETSDIGGAPGSSLSVIGGGHVFVWILGFGSHHHRNCLA